VGPNKGEKSPSAKRRIEFSFNGRSLEAFDGDTVASALVRSGVQVFSRSMKFHRPRGVYCGSGRCISCVMRVNGVPFVRTCTLPVEEGMVVRTERGFPTTNRDILSVLDHVFRHEFEYRARFIRPAFLTPVYQAVIRRLSSSSRIPDSETKFPPIERKSVEVLIIGRGLSGSVAQARIQRAGVRSVMIADRRIGHEGAVPSVAFGYYESGEVGIQEGRGIKIVRARAVLIATGRAETGVPIANGDLPGNLLPQGVQMLVSRGVSPGKKAFLIGSNASRDSVVRQLEGAGTSIVGEEPHPREVVRVVGSRKVKGVELAAQGGSIRLVRCDTVVQMGELVPSVELAQQAGCRLRDRSGRVCVETDGEGRTTVPGVYSCGGVTGLTSEEERISSGENAALTILRSRGGV